MRKVNPDWIIMKAPSRMSGHAGLTLGLVCLLLGGACPASAKPAPEWGAKSQDLALAAIHNFGICVADRTPRGPQALFALEPGSAAYAQKLSALAKGHDYCAISSEIKFNGQLFAGALAERLLANSPPAGGLTSALAYDPAKPEIKARNIVEYTGLCLARQKPADVDALFRTEPASPEEKAALGRLAGALPSCVQAGQQMKINGPGLRAIVALAAYRIVKFSDGASRAGGY